MCESVNQCMCCVYVYVLIFERQEGKKGAEIELLAVSIRFDFCFKCVQSVCSRDGGKRRRRDDG